MLTAPLVLASSSPRRRHLLTQAGFAFTVDPANIDEECCADTEPSALVRHLALEKAVVVARRHPDALVLGADTLVVLDGETLSKPRDADDAKRMLRRLADRGHTVLTGVALVHRPTARRVKVHEATDVYFGPLSDAEIEDYVLSGAPMDKAGAYGIQDDRGALYVRRIEGDYYNVVGLPLHLLHRTLRTHFADLLAGAGVPSGVR